MNQHDTLDAQLEQALDELPLVPLPDKVIPNVLAQIRPQMHIEPFRLRAVDVWLALTIAFCLAYALVFGASLDWGGFVESALTVPSLVELVREDWLLLTTVLISAEILIAIIIYAGYSLSSNNSDFEIAASR